MALFRLGFRPFYALASLFGAATLAWWLFALRGMVGTGDYLSGVAWHGHEMLYGFAGAVLAGFLLTAVRNWTGRPTPTGAPLALIAAVWVIARIATISGHGFVGALFDSVFLPLLAVAIGIPIVASRNSRNYKVLAIVLLLAVANIAFHLAVHGYLPAWLSRAALLAGIDLFVLLMAIVGGRVIVAFTRNAISGSNPRFEPWIEFTSFGTLTVAVLLSATSGYWLPPAAVATALFVIAAATQLMRLALWQPFSTVRNLLLWMLPTAYSWIPFAFLLRALAEQQVVPPSAWIHAVTTGAVSGLMLAMMMRSSLGHTGRKLVASNIDIAAYVSLQLAAVVRLLASIGPPEYLQAAVELSGAFWIAAFALFSVRFLPMLLRARVDGKPG